MDEKKQTMQETSNCFAIGTSNRQRCRQLDKEMQGSSEEINIIKKNSHRFAHGSCIWASAHLTSIHQAEIFLS